MVGRRYRFVRGENLRWPHEVLIVRGVKQIVVTELAVLIMDSKITFTEHFDQAGFSSRCDQVNSTLLNLYIYIYKCS